MDGVIGTGTKIQSPRLLRVSRGAGLLFEGPRVAFRRRLLIAGKYSDFLILLRDGSRQNFSIICSGVVSSSDALQTPCLAQTHPYT